MISAPIGLWAADRWSSKSRWSSLFQAWSWSSESSLFPGTIAGAEPGRCHYVRWCIIANVRYHILYRILYIVYDIVYDTSKTYYIVDFPLRYRRFWGCSCHLHLLCRKRYIYLSYTTSYVMTYAIVYYIIIMYDIVGQNLRYRFWTLLANRRLRHRIRCRRFSTMLYTICMSHIGIIRCCTSNTMSYVHITRNEWYMHTMFVYDIVCDV